jgi:uncharacterized protein (TIGR03435 family)
MRNVRTMLSIVAIDKTNLPGKFDFTMKWSQRALTPIAADSSNESLGPDIFTAIQEQLGLKLESSKGPVEVLVIDSVSKPTEN